MRINCLFVAALCAAAAYPPLQAHASTCSDRADVIRDHAVTASGSDHAAAQQGFARSADAHLKCTNRGMEGYGSQIDAVAADLDNAYDESNAAGSANCKYVYRERALIKNALTTNIGGFDRKGLQQRLNLISDHCL